MSELAREVTEAGFFCGIEALLGLVVSSAFMVYFLQLFI